MIHLPGLPGSPRALRSGLSAARSLHAARDRAVLEARQLERAGFEGVILENFGDAPFYKTAVPAETVASLSIIAASVRDALTIPLGINVLRNDAAAALTIASVSGADFIRVNVLSGVAATDQGIIEAQAAEWVRLRERTTPEIAIFADIQVKHARGLGVDDTTLAVEEAVERALADAVIVTGATTGRSASPERLSEASHAARRLRAPIYVGSGATASTWQALRQFADGVIVGSDLRKQGKAGAPLDPARVRAFAKAFLG